jgi:uncharacterized membrane protein
MRLWSIPMMYMGLSVAGGLTLPRLEQAYLAAHTFSLSVTSAQAWLSAAASGMMALTGVVFALAFVMVQFSAVAYSPRLVLWFARDHLLFHSMGVFSATFICALFTLAWIDRGQSGTVPLFSTGAVGVMLIVSMVLFSLLVQRLNALQISNVLYFIGDRGRALIENTFQRYQKPAWNEDQKERPAGSAALGPPVQTLIYWGRPLTIAEIDTRSLVGHARRSGGVIVMSCAVGDTLVHGSEVLRVYGATQPLPQKALLQAIMLGTQRTFEQDPKYPLRLLVDIAIRALSPAINDPTTAVQAIDQIEDLLRRLSQLDLDTSAYRDKRGVVRLTLLVPTWDDYLMLAFDEIRQFGVGSVQVMRRLRAALNGIAESTSIEARTRAVQRYLKHLDQSIKRSSLDSEDRIRAVQADRQGLGLSRQPAEPSPADR